MKAISFLAVIALAAGGFVCFSRARKFGGLKASFHKGLKDDRAALASAHKAVRGLQTEVDRELQQARQELAAAEAAYKAQVESAATALQRLEAPGNGDHIWKLGGVSLYQHKLAIGNQTIDLHGVRADAQVVTNTALLMVRLPNGQTLTERYDTAIRAIGKVKYTERSAGFFSYDIIESNQETAQAYSDAQVVEAATLIGNQAIWHEHFVAEAPARIPAARAALEEARSDTAPVADCRGNLAGVEAGTPTVAALAEARHGLADEQARYDAALKRENLGR